ncbi:MAG TPA: metallophosphoesterase [Chthonomonadales bacterium]|nr:metallophosphoesterase [Chthonomonadales bacterium]
MSTERLQISRRNLLEAAGGITFMALAPTASGAHYVLRRNGGLSAADPALPLFTALPYVQPGSAGGRLSEGKEAPVIAWQTDGVPAHFELRYGNALEHSAEISSKERLCKERKHGERRFNFAASIPGLNLNSRCRYSVQMNGETVLQGYFTTRKPRGAPVRFVAFGDNSYGDISDRFIAYQAYKARPDFVMNTGDTVYESGLDNEYARYFFPVYNADVAERRAGAPLMRSVPFYSVIANHDVHGKSAQGWPAADFGRSIDALGFYTNFYLPAGQPAPADPTPLIGPAATINSFRQCAGSRYPAAANYSFDYGDCHFLCLDSNTYVDPRNGDLQRWIETDLGSTDAAWKFVVYHHPAFNTGWSHYQEQQMRALCPLFEKHGVDFALHGHEHTYQRTRPLRFFPADTAGAGDRSSKRRLVPGRFTVDRQFDGRSVTRANGIIYITTGAGGKELYDSQCNNAPERCLHPEDNNVDYMASFISDRHSLSVFDVDRSSVLMRQIDEWGREVDRIRVTHA